MDTLTNTTGAIDPTHSEISFNVKHLMITGNWRCAGERRSKDKF